MVEIALGILIGGGIAFAVGYVIWRRQAPAQMNTLFEQSAQRALTSMMHEVVKTTREQLGAEKQDIRTSIERDLKLQTDSFKELTNALKQEINERQREIRQMEEDRNTKYGQIAQALTDYKTLTEELRGSTEQLKRVLSSNQLRGSWGELQAEKILEAAGMQSGVHYAKQQPIAGMSDLRPDFTLFLPNAMQLFVDVKFPLNALQMAFAATNKQDEERYLQQFGADLKIRIKEVGKYLVNQPKCVDYVILFVPSESVFEIINKHFPAIVDSSFSQQVILVSPHSFFAVVRTIQESYTHFYYEQNLKEILHHLEDLLTNFDRFKNEFADVGRALTTAQTKYAQITETRYRQIARGAERIQQYQLETAEPPVALPLVSPQVSDEDVTA